VGDNDDTSFWNFEDNVWNVEDSVTDASGTTEGTTAQKVVRFSYDGDDDDDDDEDDICRELAQLN